MTMTWPVDIGGRWSHRQAVRVIEANKEYADANGLELVAVDITAMCDPTPWAFIIARQKKEKS